MPTIVLPALTRPHDVRLGGGKTVRVRPGTLDVTDAELEGLKAAKVAFQVLSVPAPVVEAPTAPEPEAKPNKKTGGSGALKPSSPPSGAGASGSQDSNTGAGA